MTDFDLNEYLFNHFKAIRAELMKNRGFNMSCDIGDIDDWYEQLKECNIIAERETEALEIALMNQLNREVQVIEK